MLSKRIVKYLVLFFSILISFQAVEASEKVHQSKVFYKAIKHDVTGDKVNDLIELKGKINKKNKKWAKALKLTVKSNNQIISISLKSGFHPNLSIGDINHDGVKDVLVTIIKHDKQPVSKIYSFKGEDVTQIALPPPVPVTAQFQDDYVAEISVEGQKNVKVDISSHRAFYEKLGIYDHGKLNEATELIVNPYSEFALSSSFGRGKGVLGKQTIQGVGGNDAIATISTSWTYIDGDWKLQKIKVKPVKNKKYTLL